MNDKVPVFVICVEASIHLLLYDLHDSTFKFSNIFDAATKNKNNRYSKEPIK